MTWMLLAILIVASLLVWRWFIYAVKRWPVTTQRELIVRFTANVQDFTEALQRVQISAREAARSIQKFDDAWRAVKEHQERKQSE